MATAVSVRNRETFNGILAAAKTNLSEVTRNACMLGCSPLGHDRFMIANGPCPCHW